MNTYSSRPMNATARLRVGLYRRRPPSITTLVARPTVWMSEQTIQDRPVSRARSDEVRPKLVVLTERWPIGGADWSAWDEDALVTRRVAGALAASSDVNVITPEGNQRAQFADGAFSVHQLGNALAPVDDLRRSLVIELLMQSRSQAQPDSAPNLSSAGPTVSASASRWLQPWSVWDGAKTLLDQLAPRIVLLAGHRHVGLRPVAASVGVPVIWLPLFGDDAPRALSLFDDLSDVAAVVIETGPGAATVPLSAGPTNFRDVGLVVDVNPSVEREPHPVVAGENYALVLSPAPSESTGGSAGLVRIVAGRIKDAVVVVHPDALVVWRGGARQAVEPLTRQLDLWRLMAWAGCTIHLRRGRIVARHVIESLRYGTPAIVPAGGVAHRTVRSANGGVWFRDGAELIACIEAVINPEVGSVLGAQGRAYCDDHYGSTRSFVDRVVGALPARLDQGEEAELADR